MKKVFLSVGEVSADIYASYIVKNLKDKYIFTGIAGNRMIGAGVHPISKIDDISVVGLVEVISKYGKIKEVFHKAIQKIKECDVVIAVDFPGFNLKLIQQAKKLNKKVIYFISPQIWAWHYSRIYKIVKNTDLMISILPFEEEYYKPFIGENFKFVYVGHPLLDIVKPQTSFEMFLSALNLPSKHMFIGLLPGSRESEVKNLLPIMLKSATLINNAIPSTYFLIPATDNLKDLVKEIVKGFNIPLKVISSENFKNPSYEVMKHSKFSLIASGTATLEASIIGNPFLILYRVNPITFYIGKKIVKIKNIGLPNIIAGTQIIEELLQENCNSIHIANRTLSYLLDEDLYQKTKKELESVKSKLGQEGAIERISEIIQDFIDRL